MKQFVLILILLILIMVIKGFSQELGKGFGMRGQLIAWGVTKPFDSFQSQIGARYIPELNYEHMLKEKYTLDAEVQLNMYG